MGKDKIPYRQIMCLHKKEDDSVCRKCFDGGLTVQKEHYEKEMDNYQKAGELLMKANELLNDRCRQHEKEKKEIKEKIRIIICSKKGCPNCNQLQDMIDKAFKNSK